MNRQPNPEALKAMAGLLAQGNRRLADLREYLRRYHDFMGQVDECDRVIRDNADVIMTLNLWSEVRPDRPRAGKIGTKKYQIPNSPEGTS